MFLSTMVSGQLAVWIDFKAKEQEPITLETQLVKQS
jgi:hypothetical protein